MLALPTITPNGRAPFLHPEISMPILPVYRAAGINEFSAVRPPRGPALTNRALPEKMKELLPRSMWACGAVWERASMAWKRSSVRSRPGPPNPSIKIRHLDEPHRNRRRKIWCQSVSILRFRVWTGVALWCGDSPRFGAETRRDFARLLRCRARLPQLAVNRVDHPSDALRNDVLVDISFRRRARMA
jgi:hypothetical protein